jgi:hypothetical protein
MIRLKRTNPRFCTKITKNTKITTELFLVPFVNFVDVVNEAWQRTRRTSLVACLTALAVVGSCGLALAQQPGSDPSFERMRAKLKAGDRVTVDLQNGSTLEGRFIDVGPDALSVSTAVGDRKLLPSEVVQVHRTRRGVLLGAIIGGGVGLTFGALVGTIFAAEGHDRDGPLFGLTAVGLGTGIAIDALVNLPRTVYQRTASRAALKFEAGPRRTSVGVVIAF